MTKKGKISQKYVFLQALILTFIVFNIGIFFGYKLESSRIDNVNELYLESEMNLLDQTIQKEAFDIVDLNCEDAIQANIEFADKIFEDAKIISRFENANRINNDIIFQHKRFDILRTLFWINSIKIKQKCNSQYHNIVYFYQYNEPSLEQKAKQRVFSNLLFEIKENQGGNVMLIPIAADLNISSINLLLKKYEIEQLPVILIDESVRIEDIETVGDIEKHLT